MWLAIGIVVVVIATLAFFEWRSWKKPLAKRLQDPIGTHSTAQNALFHAMTGGRHTRAGDHRE